MLTAAHTLPRRHWSPHLLSVLSPPTWFTLVLNCLICLGWREFYPNSILVVWGWMLPELIIFSRPSARGKFINGFDFPSKMTISSLHLPGWSQWRYDKWCEVKIEVIYIFDWFCRLWILNDSLLHELNLMGLEIIYGRLVWNRSVRCRRKFRSTEKKTIHDHKNYVLESSKNNPSCKNFKFYPHLLMV